MGLPGDMGLPGLPGLSGPPGDRGKAGPGGPKVKRNVAKNGCLGDKFLGCTPAPSRETLHGVNYYSG